MTYSINGFDNFNGFEPEFVSKLKKAGIRTTDKLLEVAKSQKGRQTLAQKADLDPKVILRAVNLADRMRIKGVGPDFAELLDEAGVSTLRELTYRNPARLAKAMAEVNVKRKLVRALPTEQTIEQWIERAKKLPMIVSY
jgi:predicted flap endonuclease-1-like 5' DNA nuclease